MHLETITDQHTLQQLCERLATAPEVAFDTEFVSEDTFHPDLCLLQIATRDETAVVDASAVDDLGPFWQMLTQTDGTVVVHAGREELNFVLRAVDRLPARLFDVQIAAGFCSHEFPAAYGSLVNRFLGHRPLKGEQRTDWRKRPLTDAQIKYALEDVRYLLPLYDQLQDILRESEREVWLAEELQDWQEGILAARDRKDWRRVSGIGKLGPRGLAIVRELWYWRQDEAQRRNLPPRRVLRDDLMIELAKRRIDRVDQILAIRGLQRGALKKKADQLAECVRRGLEAPAERIPRSSRQHGPPQLNLLGQFLTPALASICHHAEVAASMVGTATDVRDLVAYHLGFTADEGDPPILTRGWRAELVGNLINDLLDGKRSIRITDACSEDPLAFDDVG